MRAYVDKESCISCELCPSLCPDVFKMEDDGKAGAITGEIPEDAVEAAQEAEQSCPVNAISIS
ncbi:ferredoxin [Clostridium sp. USBA 49]|jgi:ferredoxin|uniref:ferredoxin n=1 Tax=Clostridium TaxID=1485 RepID=UPI0009999FF0|nr:MULTISPECIES: ferredoxin [Clostridium]SKA82799.1 ferredoxin [Clostridium sp. USBA 49]